jgi:hypothetical protein
MARNNTNRLEALTLALWVDQEIEKQVWQGTAVSKKLYAQKKTGGGFDFNKNISLDMANPIAAFAVGDSYTPTTLDNVDSLKLDYAHFGGALTMNEINISQNGSPEGRVNMVTDALDTFKRWQQEQLSQSIWRGTNSSNTWAGLLGYWLANQTGDVAGVTRNLSQQLVPNLIKANSVGSSNAGTVAVTVDSTTLTGTSTTYSTDGIVAGDTIRITDAAGAVHEHLIATVTSDTALVLATTYKGTTASGLSATATGHFYDTAFYGATGVFNIEKATHAQRVAGNGGLEKPDIGATTPALFERFEAMLRAKNNSTVESNDPGIKGFDNFMFNRTAMVQDVKACSASTGAPYLVFLNTEFIRMQFLKGWDKYEISPNEAGNRLVRVDSSSGEKFATVVGQVVMSGNLMVTAPNRQSVLTDIVA